jgi:DNA repair protein RecO (recombination protein O)
MDEEAHAFLVEALGRPLAQTPMADARALRQAERAIAETVEHHAGIRLREAVAR